MGRALESRLWLGELSLEGEGESRGCKGKSLLKLIQESIRKPEKAGQLVCRGVEAVVPSPVKCGAAMERSYERGSMPDEDTAGVAMVR